jgi:GTP cyclohydrolase II
MKHMPSRDGVASGAAGTRIDPALRPDAAALSMRAVHRAVADLKRGTPVLLRAGRPLALLPAETAGARGLAEFNALAAGPPVLLLAPARAAAVLHRPVASGPVTARTAIALRLAPALLEPATLRSLADPTAEQMLPAEPALAPDSPAAAPAALALVKLARLLPAVLAAPAAPEADLAAVELNLLTVDEADVLAYPNTAATHVVRVAEAHVPLDGAPDARIIAFRAPDTGIEHLAILVGRPEESEAPLVRLHSECFTGDLLGSLRCDCGPQLRGAILRMARDGAGVLLYLAQEGRGIGLVNKLRAYALQDRGLDTVDANRALGWGADERNFLLAATMLEQLGVRRARLLTNNPDKVAALAACGLEVAREPHAFEPNGINDHYLATKAERFGHLLG